MILKIKYIYKWFLRFLYSPFLYLIYLLSFLFPRKKDYYVFISHGQNGFSDNCKYFFLYLNNNDLDNKKIIWMTKNNDLANKLKSKGFISYYCFSLKGIYSLLTSKYFIFDSFLPGIYFWLSGKSIKINLWHGVGLKKSNHDIEKGKQKNIYNSKGIRKIIAKILVPHIFLNSKTNYFITTSKKYKEISHSAFKISKKKIFICGYPRNDIFFRKIKGSMIGTDSELTKLINNSKKRIILYVPTFRDTKKNIFIENTKNIISKISDSIKDDNILFIFKPHPNTVNDFKFFNKDNVYVLSSDFDVYPILPKVDTLITDYSSISSDFLLLDKKIIFFPYDKIKYETSDRDLYFKYEKYTPGPKVYNVNDLIKEMTKNEKEIDDYKEKRKEIIKIYFDHKDGNSSKRIWNKIND